MKIPFRYALLALLIPLFAVIVSPQVLGQAKIIGGTNASHGDYPWMTAIVEKGRSVYNGHYCGGSLVGNQWVLTAAHCVTRSNGSKEDPRDIEVWINLTDLSQPGGAAVKRSVIAIYRHPDYREDSAGNLFHDVALLLLNRPVGSVAPIVLAQNNSQTPEDTAVRALGWGAVSKNGNNYPPRLKEVNLKIFNFGQANNAYTGDLRQGPHLPAGVPNGSKDTCTGDSGGPLFLPNAGNPVLVGVTSFGEGCGKAGVPGIYARVSSYANGWIEPRVNLTVSPPDLLIKGRGHTIEHGDRSPRRADSTYMGTVRLGGRPRSRNFRVVNLGAGALTVSRASVSSGLFSVFRKPPTIIRAGQGAAMGIRVEPGNRRRFVRSKVNLSTNDPTHPTYVFTVKARVRR